MYNSYEIPRDATGVRGLIRRIIVSMENKLSNIEYFHLKYDCIDKLDKSFTINWSYGLNGGFRGSLLVSDKEENRVIANIDHFWGVDCGGSHSSKQLRTAAEIHDKFKDYLVELCGKPVSSHDGRDIYRLENVCEEVSV